MSAVLLTQHPGMSDSIFKAQGALICVAFYNVTNSSNAVSTTLIKVSDLRYFEGVLEEFLSKTAFPLFL